MITLKFTFPKVKKGGPGSGHFGHSGRPGKRGGSSGGSGGGVDFQTWFGDSKVVDASGNPVVVYHKTTQDFQGAYNVNERGIYFASDPSVVNDSFGDVVKKAYLHITNPDPDAVKLLSYMSVKNAIQESISNGYDGWIRPITAPGPKIVGYHYTVFEPTQIWNVN